MWDVSTTTNSAAVVKAAKHQHDDDDAALLNFIAAPAGGMFGGVVRRPAERFVQEIATESIARYRIVQTSCSQPRYDFTARLFSEPVSPTAGTYYERAESFCEECGGVSTLPPTILRRLVV